MVIVVGFSFPVSAGLQGKRGGPSCGKMWMYRSAGRGLFRNEVVRSGNHEIQELKIRNNPPSKYH